MKRHLQFEAMERRVTMSVGLGHPGVAPDAVHEVDAIKGRHTPVPGLVPTVVQGGMSRDLAHLAAAIPKSAKIKGSLAGGQSSVIGGSNTVAMGGFSGKLGKVPLQAAIYGTVSGKSLLDGSLHLFNPQGDMIANLGPGKLVKKGKFEDAKVEFEFEQGTGAYAQVAGWAGTATIELKVAKSPTKAVSADQAPDPLWHDDLVDLILFLLSDPGKLATYLFGP